MELGAEDLVRAQEWRRVREFAVGSRDHPAALTVGGSSGAGKSTLWRAGTVAAGAAGCRVLCSEPSMTDAQLAFAGLTDLLTDVLPDLSEDIPAPQREALEVALLLRPAGSAPPTAHAVGLGVLAALRGLAALSPLMVAIDDVHWLDDASLDALAFAVRRTRGCPVGLLLAVRTEVPADPLATAAPPPSQRWRDLVADVPNETIDLAPLDAQQVRKILPIAMSAASAGLVAEQSRGNPFWAKEIAKSLESAQTPIPALARTLTDRLARSLTAGAAEALALVGAAGRISVGGALRVLQYLDDPAAALDEAVLAGVITEAAGRLVPAHPLIGAAAVEALPPGHRQQIYRRIADAAGSPEKYAHFAALAAGKADETVAAALDAAADSAHARAGNTEAAQFAVRAVQLTPSGGDALEQRRIRAAELLYVAGDLHASLDQAEAVDLTSLPTPDLERLLPLLVGLTNLVHGATAATAIVTRLCDDTEADARRRALLLALASDFAYGVRGRRQAAATEAIHAAETAGAAADASLHRALLNLAIAKVTAGDGLDNELLDRAEQLEAGLHLDRLRDSADLQRGLWSRRVEDLDTSRAALKRNIGYAREAGDDFILATLLSHLASVEELAGHYSAAREALAEAGAAAMWHDWPRLPWHAEPRCNLLIADGDLDAALVLADQTMPDDPDQPAMSRFLGNVIRGRANAWRGNQADAVHWFERAAAAADECEFADPGVLRGLDTALAEAYLAEGRPAEARRIAGWLREIGDRLHRPTLTGNAYRIEAEAAAFGGDLDAAEHLARQAVVTHETAPLRLELTRSLLVLGQIERRRRARKRSRTALIRARDLARDIGHQPLLALVEAELPRVAAVRTGAELTATEQRVAELIAAGASNRDAAAALFVSVRTIETHVGSIYRKLGVRSRAELGRRFSPSSNQQAPTG